MQYNIWNRSPVSPADRSFRYELPRSFVLCLGVGSLLPQHSHEVCTESVMFLTTRRLFPVISVFLINAVQLTLTLPRRSLLLHHAFR